MFQIIAICLFLAIPYLANAEFFICGNGPRPQCEGTVGLTQVHDAIDPTRVTDPTCVMVPDAQIDSQLALIQNVSASSNNPPGRCYLTRVGNLAAEMTQPQKDVVNSAFAAKAAAQAAKNDELTNNDFCNNLTKQQITDKIASITTQNTTDIASLDGLETGANSIQSLDGLETGSNSIATITDFATLRAFLLRMNDANQALLLRINNAHQTVLTSLQTRDVNGFEKLASCIWARTTR